MSSDNLSTVLDFLKTLENRTSTAELERFFHPEIEQREFPNSVTKNLAIRNLHALKEASDRGQKVMTKERYEILKSYSIGDTVIIECIFRGTLAIPLGTIPAGGDMVAYFAQFYDFKDGKIYRWRNYDCFEPFN